MARKLPSSGKQANGVAGEYVGDGHDRTMTFEIADVVDLALESVRLDKTPAKAQNGKTPVLPLPLPCRMLIPSSGAASNFRTDTDISAGRFVRERDLQKWDGSADPTGVDLSLDGSGVASWDQFATNKQITGLESTYDENIYTTTINKQAPDYSERLAKAERKAREIQASSTGGNRHMMEERGLKLEDSGVDEETK